MGRPSITSTRVKGHAMANWSQERRSTSPQRTAPAIGTTTAPVALAATTAPALAMPRGPRGPSTANAESAPSLCIAATKAASPRAPPRELDPRTTHKPCIANARACRAPSRDQLTSTTVRPRLRHARSGHWVPCQNASTQGRWRTGSRAGSYCTRTRRVDSHKRATTPTTHPSQSAARGCFTS